MNRRRPNVLLFFTDQQRYDTIGALGNSVIKTPNLDRLVESGVAFTNAFTPSPVCVPARASMHYGQYPGKTGCFSNPYSMPADRKSYVDLLSEADYETIGIGKCHFTPDRTANRGFRRRIIQEEVPQRIEDDDYLQFTQGSPYRQVRDIHGVWADEVYMPQTSPLPADHHPSQWVGDKTIEFINEQAGKNNALPWFTFCSFIHPHPPYAPPAPWDTLYDPDDVDDPHLPDDMLGRQNIYIRGALHNYYMDPPISRTLWRKMRSRYYACVSFVDYQIGRVMESIEKTGQLENTIVIFASDHGDMLGDLGLIGKEDMYGPAVRVPLIVRLPGNDGGRIIDSAVNLVDIPVAILKAAGVDVPSDFDGENLLDIIENPCAYQDRIVLSQVHEKLCGIYMAANSRFKYAYSAADDREILHEYAVDPDEDYNLIDDPDYSVIADELRNTLFAYAFETKQEEALEMPAKTWAKWPRTSPSGNRSRSNTPCPWASHLDFGCDLSKDNGG